MRTYVHTGDVQHPGFVVKAHGLSLFDGMGQDIEGLRRNYKKTTETEMITVWTTFFLAKTISSPAIQFDNDIKEFFVKRIERTDTYGLVAPIFQNF